MRAAWFISARRGQIDRAASASGGRDGVTRPTINFFWLSVIISVARRTRTWRASEPPFTVIPFIIFVRRVRGIVASRVARETFDNRWTYCTRTGTPVLSCSTMPEGSRLQAPIYFNDQRAPMVLLIACTKVFDYCTYMTITYAPFSIIF